MEEVTKTSDNSSEDTQCGGENRKHNNFLGTKTFACKVLKISLDGRLQTFL